jgi:magnesium-transporting ATPase (P-type)
MVFYDAFFGSDQSQYTAYAIITAIIAICITILLNATDISINNRLLIVFFVIISLIPSVLLTLFQLTCIVTGGTEPNKWWCYVFGWILAAFIIIYCIFIIIISLLSLFNYKKTIDNLKETGDKKLIEKFYDNSEEEDNTSFQIAATVSPEYPLETTSPIYDNENF